MTKSEVYSEVLNPMRAAFSPSPHLAKTDEPAALEQYADALRGFDERDLQAGWATARDGNKRGFWPPIGALVEVCVAARKARLDSAPKHQVLHGRVIEGEYQPWGGSCRCRRCADLRPSQGFWHAPKEFVEAAAKDRRDAQGHFDYQFEQLPPALRGETMRAYRYRVHQLRAEAFAA